MVYTVDAVDTVDTAYTVCTIETALHCFNNGMYGYLYCLGYVYCFWSGLGVMSIKWEWVTG